MVVYKTLVIIYEISFFYQTTEWIGTDSNFAQTHKKETQLAFYINL